MEIKSLGNNGLVIYLGIGIEKKVHQQVLLLRDALKKNDYIKSLIPAYNSLTLEFDHFSISKEKLMEEIQSIQLNQLDKPQQVQTLQIPVCYDSAFGPDLPSLAAQMELSEEELIELHCSQTYTVYMLGFLPGFPYMGNLHEKLHCSRLASPRNKVGAGSVGLAGEQTGIYPLDAPGGWQLIGRTPLTLFNPHAQESFLFSQGDEVRFYPISKEEFQEIKMKGSSYQITNNG